MKVTDPFSEAAKVPLELATLVRTLTYTREQCTACTVWTEVSQKQKQQQFASSGKQPLLLTQQCWAVGRQLAGSNTNTQCAELTQQQW